MFLLAMMNVRPPLIPIRPETFRPTSVSIAISGSPRVPRRFVDRFPTLSRRSLGIEHAVGMPRPVVESQALAGAEQRAEPQGEFHLVVQEQPIAAR